MSNHHFHFYRLLVQLDPKTLKYSRKEMKIFLLKVVLQMAPLDFSLHFELKAVLHKKPPDDSLRHCSHCCSTSAVYQRG